MEFKVCAMKSSDSWDIINKKTNEVVGEIRITCHAPTVTKLYVKDTCVDEVRGQKQACELLKSYLEGVRTQILTEHLKLDSLKRDLLLVKSEHSYKLIQGAIFSTEKVINHLEFLLPKHS